MKKVLKRILPRKIKLFIIEHRYMFKILKIKYKKQLKNEINKCKSLSIDDRKKWINKLVKLSYSDPDFIKLGNAFCKSDIKIIRNLEIDGNDIILICVEKNDLMKLKEFVKHHRNIGINKFIILDNDSDDGTIDWLLKQNDVILLQTKMQYSSINRVAWINRIIAHFGDNRWYAILDSDELLIYDNYDKKNIRNVIEYCEANNIIRARALMLEMYAKEEFYKRTNSDKYLEECIYYDKDTYYIKPREDFIHVSGGPRERIFNISTCLTKYPLIYFRSKDVICNSHFLYPYKENLNNDCFLTIKHYKFLPSDIKKYKVIVENKNYYNNSIAYKKIMDSINKSSSINFIYENSHRYENYSSLNNIDMYKKIDWNYIKKER